MCIELSDSSIEHDRSRGGIREETESREERLLFWSWKEIRKMVNLKDLNGYTQDELEIADILRRIVVDHPGAPEIVNMQLASALHLHQLKGIKQAIEAIRSDLSNFSSRIEE
jgi:hypothetical protein